MRPWHEHAFIWSLFVIPQVPENFVSKSDFLFSEKPTVSSDSVRNNLPKRRMLFIIISQQCLVGMNWCFLLHTVTLIWSVFYKDVLCFCMSWPQSSYSSLTPCAIYCGTEIHCVAFHPCNTTQSVKTQDVHCLTSFYCYGSFLLCLCFIKCWLFLMASGIWWKRTCGSQRRALHQTIWHAFGKPSFVDHGKSAALSWAGLKSGHKFGFSGSCRGQPRKTVMAAGNKQQWLSHCSGNRLEEKPITCILLFT